MRFVPALLLTLSLTLISSLFPSPVFALHRARAPTVAAGLAKNKLSVGVTFANLTGVRSASYQLTYNSSRGPQGAGGTIRNIGRSRRIGRRLLLGTCSGRVCTYHQGVRNLKFSVNFTLKSGGVVSYEKAIK